MKFGRELQQRLEKGDLPEEWVEAAIQYKALKKCINKVVHELEFLGLSQSTLKLLLDNQAVEVNTTTPDNPIIAQYTLTKSKGCNQISPSLKISPGADHHPQVWARFREELTRYGGHVVEVREDEGELTLSPTPSNDEYEGDEGDIIIQLNSDAKFFMMLDEELDQLDDLRQREERRLLGDCQGVAVDVGKLAQNKDLYTWRQLFRIYLDSEVYFRYNETTSSAMERDGEQVKQNLSQFMVNVKKSGVLDNFKSNRSVPVFNTFMDLNFHLLKILRFQSINSTALRKIIKKFDKQTNFGIKNEFSRLVEDNHIFLHGKSLAQSVCYIIQSQILQLVPQLEDYTCPVCMSVAYKPIRLGCGHTFCVRCLVKMKQSKKGDCPICRSPKAILAADGGNLDMESMALMEKYFPIEVKQKLKERNQERFHDFKGGKHGEKCVIT